MLLAVLNQTIVATALARIVDDLGGADRHSWVFTAYMLALAVTVPIYGRLSDIHGRRPLILSGLALFMVGSIIGATSGSMTQLILARGVLLIPLAMAVIGDLDPATRASVAAHDRGRWQGVTGAAFGAGSVLGPLCGGWIADHADWRWVFLLSLPIALLAFAVVALTLRIPLHPDRSRGTDLAGAGLLVVGLLTGLLAVMRGGQDAPWLSPQILGLIATSVIVLIVFAAHERRTAEPIFPVELLHGRVFAVANAMGFVVGVAISPRSSLRPCSRRTYLARQLPPQVSFSPRSCWRSSPPAPFPGK
jgi:MFS family permease